jgi:uncharacterized protein YjbI with pentapeptide repeats
MLAGMVVCASLAAAYPRANFPNAVVTVRHTDEPGLAAHQQNDEAQTRYYEILARKAEEQQSLPQLLLSNLGALGATLAAIVALLSFGFNYRATSRNQKDTQFYEALKRIGDKDSPTLRASAAGLIAQMAQKSTFGKARRSPYFDTAIDQLTTCLALENDDAVIGAAEKAIVQFTHVDARRIIHRIHAQNIDLQDHLVTAIATFFASREADVTEVSGFDYKSAAAVSAFDEAVFRGIGSGNVFKRFEAASLVTPRDPPEEAARFQASAIAALRAAATRLRASARALAATVRRAQPSRPSWLLRTWLPSWWRVRFGDYLGGADLSGAFLSGADLSGTNLSDANLSGANLIHADLRVADLRGADLMRAFLSGTDLRGADLSRAFLSGADLSGAFLSGADLSGTDLSGTDLSRAMLSGAFLSGADLSNANLSGADLSNANLSGANLSHADLRDTSLSGAKLSRANLEGTLRSPGDRLPRHEGHDA